MNSAVIFDMDGVLVNSEPYHFEVERLILKNLGIDNISDEVIHSFVGLAMDKFCEKLKERFSLKKSIADLLKEDTEFRVNYFKNIGKMEAANGVKSLLVELSKQQIKLAVASSSHSDLIKTVLDAAELTQYFPVCLSGFQVKHGKPEPDIFLETAKMLGTTPQRCVVIEDSHNGVIAAKKAAMKCVGYQNPTSGRQDLTAADVIIKSFLEVTPKFLIEL